MANAAYTTNRDLRDSWVSKPGRSRFGVSLKSTMFATVAVSAARPSRAGNVCCALRFPKIFSWSMAQPVADT
jgi:hypothetical protein